jgi:hypothetical protein
LGGDRKWGTQRRANFSIPALSEKFLSVSAYSSGSVAQALEHWQKDTFEETPQIGAPRSRAAVRCVEHPYRKVAVSKILEPDFDLRPAERISSECGHELLIDLFRAPVLHPEIFDKESLFLFLHPSSITCFVNLINSKPFL